MADLRQALEQAVLDDPDDLSAHMAYADHLTEQGEPRGELISVQLALEDEGHPRRQELRRREGQLLNAHLREWLGELAPLLLGDVVTRAGLKPPSFQLRRGWLDTLDVAILNAPLARGLCTVPIARGLRHLEVSIADDNEFDHADSPADEVLTLLADAPFLPRLLTFQYGDPEPDEMDVLNLPHGELYGGCSARGNEIPSLVKAMTRLQELRLFQVQSEEMENLYALQNFNHLRVLQVHHLQDYDLLALARNASLTRLERLLLMPHAACAGDSSSLPCDDVIAFLRSPAARALTHLQLRMSDLGDKGIAAMIRTGLLSRLEELDLRHGCVTDTGARALARALLGARLRRLDLQRNRLTQRGIAALEALGLPALRVEHQQEPGAGGEYDDGYLYDGDWE
jgi:uncharacterized protein (TIGR02996 family)